MAAGMRGKAACAGRALRRDLGGLGEECLPAAEEGFRCRSSRELRDARLRLRFGAGPRGAAALTPTAPSRLEFLPIHTAPCKEAPGPSQLQGAAPDKHPTAGAERNGAASPTASTSQSITLVLAPLLGRESKGSLVRRDGMTGRKARG